MKRFASRESRVESQRRLAPINSGSGPSTPDSRLEDLQRRNHCFLEIDAALQRNKIDITASLRTRWFTSDVPVTQIALYKIIGSDEEAYRLNGSRMDVTSKNEPITAGVVKIIKGEK